MPQTLSKVSAEVSQVALSPVVPGSLRVEFLLRTLLASRQFEQPRVSRQCGIDSGGDVEASVKDSCMM